MSLKFHLNKIFYSYFFRAERFGIESKEVIASKKNQRAARFGLEANGKPKNEVDEKKRARAERFGTANGSGGKKVKINLEKLKFQIH